MKNIFGLLATTATLALATSAFAANEAAENKSSVEYKKDGGYEAKAASEKVNAAGTKTATESKVDVDVKNDGRVSKTTKTETTTDAKGLMNEKKDVQKTKLEEKKDGGYKETATSTHTDAEGTNVKAKATTEVDVNAAGDVTKTQKVEKTVDPKGLMNKETTTTTTKEVNGNVVEKKTK